MHLPHRWSARICHSRKYGSFAKHGCQQRCPSWTWISFPHLPWAGIDFTSIIHLGYSLFCDAFGEYIKALLLRPNFHLTFSCITHYVTLFKGIGNWHWILQRWIIDHWNRRQLGREVATTPQKGGCSCLHCLFPSWIAHGHQRKWCQLVFELELRVFICVFIIFIWLHSITYFWNSGWNLHVSNHGLLCRFWFVPTMDLLLWNDCHLLVLWR